VFVEFKRFSKVISMVLIILLIYTPFVFSMDTSVAILGDVVGNGSAEMKTAFDRWISVAGKSYPIVDGSNLRSGEGRMSMVLRDGVRLEVGKNSNTIVNGSRGNYTIHLLSGSVGFIVPEGISFSVATPTSNVKVQSKTSNVRRITLVSEDNTRGLVIYDGKGTKVISVGGILMVEDTTGKGMQMLTSGNSLYVDEMGIGNASRVTPVQIAEGEGGSDLTKLLTIIGIGVGLGVGGLLLFGGSSGGGDGDGDEEPASPSIP
jgi:hypothetical protein